MDKKSRTETPRRSPYLCCDTIYYSSFVRTALISVILVLCLSFVGLIIIGSLYAGRSAVFIYITACVLLSAAAMLAVFYIWLNKRSPLLRMDCPSKMPNKSEISTLSSGLDYYSQTPSGRKSDFPMGPYLVMTLPRSSNGRIRSGTMDTENSSSPNTPRPLKKKANRRAKNLPPLASAETLTPSLISSCYGSIDSVV